MVPMCSSRTNVGTQQETGRRNIQNVRRFFRNKKVRFKILLLYKVLGRRSGFMVSELVFGLSSLSASPGRGHWLILWPLCHCIKMLDDNHPKGCIDAFSCLWNKPVSWISFIPSSWFIWGLSIQQSWVYSSPMEQELRFCPDYFH